MAACNLIDSGPWHALLRPHPPRLFTQPNVSLSSLKTDFDDNVSTFGLHVDHVGDGTGRPLAMLLRAGNAGANTAADHITVCDQALTQLAKVSGYRVGRSVLVRIDSAGSTHDFLDYLTPHDHHRKDTLFEAVKPDARRRLGPLTHGLGPEFGPQTTTSGPLSKRSLAHEISRLAGQTAHGRSANHIEVSDFFAPELTTVSVNRRASTDQGLTSRTHSPSGAPTTNLIAAQHVQDLGVSATNR